MIDTTDIKNVVPLINSGINYIHTRGIRSNDYYLIVGVTWARFHPNLAENVKDVFIERAKGSTIRTVYETINGVGVLIMSHKEVSK